MKHCYACRGTDRLHVNSKNTLKNGEINYHYICNVCHNERTKRYYHSHPEKFRAIIYKSIAKYAWKQAARQKVAYALLKGIIKRPEQCSACQVECQPQAHHINYSFPLQIKWLCTYCHSIADRKLEKTLAPVA